MSVSETIRRRVQWMDTDAAGIWHHSVVIRWTEEAEAELHRRLGIVEETFGVTPRVKTEFDFTGSVRFDELVDITLRVGALGETSVTYEIEIVSESGTVATGRLVAVLIDRETGEPRGWPRPLRDALTPEG